MARKTLTASGVVTANAAVLRNIFIGTDGTNDVTAFVVYNNSAASGEKVIPTCAFEADYKGLNGAVGIDERCPSGIYVSFTCAGTCTVVVSYDDEVYGKKRG